MSSIIRTKSGLRRLIVPSKATAGIGRTVPKQNLRAFTSVGFRKRNIGYKNCHENFVKPKEEATEGTRVVQRKAHTFSRAHIPGAKRSESILPPKGNPLLRYVLIVDNPKLESDEVLDALNYCTIHGIPKTIVDINDVNVMQVFTDIVKQSNTNPMSIHIVIESPSNTTALDTIHQLLLRRVNADIKCLVVCSNPQLDTNKRHHFRAPHVQRTSFSLPLSVESSDHSNARTVVDDINAAV